MKNREEVASPTADSMTRKVPAYFWKVECSAVVQDEALILIEKVDRPSPSSKMRLVYSYKDFATDMR